MTAVNTTVEQLAEQVGYHPKQVGRWLELGQVPRRAGTTATVARLLNVAESNIWPTVVAQDTMPTDIVDVLDERAAVSRETWLGLINSCEEHLNLFAFSATFFYQLSGR